MAVSFRPPRPAPFGSARTARRPSRRRPSFTSPRAIRDSSPHVLDVRGHPAALNADTVDGLSAVKATSTKNRRKGKLVATDAKGFLPSNIVKAKWGLIAGRPAFVDRMSNNTDLLVA